MAGPISLPGVKGALRGAAAVLLPVSCAACGTAGQGLCGACGLRLRESVRIVAEGETVPGVPLVSAAAYEGVAAALVRALKLRGRVDAAPALAGLLRIALLAALRVAPGTGGEPGAIPQPGPPAEERPVLLAAVPSRAAAERARGMRHLAEACAHAVPGTAVLPVLRFARRVADQHALSAAGRRRNLAGSMRASRSVAGRRIVLVDDVVTSGATVREAARAVHAAGGRVIAIAVMTRAASTVSSRSAAP